MEICVLCKMHVSFLFTKIIRKVIFNIEKMEKYGKIKRKEHREENWIIKVLEGLPNLLRVFREGLAKKIA